MGIYARDARIGETDYVGNIEDQGKHNNGDKSVISWDRSDQDKMLQLARFTIN